MSDEDKMSKVADRIEQLLCAQFAPTALSVMDDSAKHAGHAGARAGGESHFTVKIVSDAFAGKSRVERHRMVYAVLQPLFDAGLHALVIEAKAPAEG
jgi:BolA family transcriptional regulator, general stress-responsive regulator